MSTPDRGLCPVCHGSLREPAGDAPYRHYRRDYRESDNTIPCRNCGGQTMLGIPTGQVRLRPDGTPCTHHYLILSSSMTYVVYKCEHCGHIYDIDSGD